MPRQQKGAKHLLFTGTEDPNIQESMRNLYLNVLSFCSNNPDMPPPPFDKREIEVDRNAFLTYVICTLNYAFRKSGNNFEDIFKEDPNNICWLEKVIKRVYSILKDDKEYNVAIELEDQKSEKKSVELREKGNALFVKNELKAAMIAYNDSIASAPHSSSLTTLAFAFANRGFCLKVMRHFKESIEDTQRALCYNYPSEMQYKLYVRMGQSYMEIQENEIAKKCFEDAINLVSKSKLTKEEQVKITEEIHDDIAKCKLQAKYLVPGNGKPFSQKDAGLPLISPAPPPHLTGGCSKDSASLSKRVAITYSTSMGRHLIAAQDIKPGDVLMVETANCALLEDHFKWNHCGHCFKHCYNPIPCKDCNWNMYCSDDCLKAASKYHKLECAVTPFFKTHFNFLEVLAIRLVAKIGVEELNNIAENLVMKRPVTEEELKTIGCDEAGKLPSDAYGLLSYYYDHDWNCIDICRFSILSVTLIKLCKLENSVKDISKFGAMVIKLIHSMSRVIHVHVKEHEVKGKQYRYNHIGTFASTSLGLLKHSCNPNVVLHQHKTTTVMRAVQVIRRGEKLTMTYSDQVFTKHPKVKRHDELKLSVPNCNCEACSGNWPMDGNLPTAPIFNFPDEKDKYASFVAASDIMAKNSLGKEGEFLVTKESLPSVLRVIMLLDKFNKKLNECYYDRVEDATEYFAKQGNLFNNKYFEDSF